MMMEGGLREETWLGELSPGHLPDHRTNTHNTPSSILYPSWLWHTDDACLCPVEHPWAAPLWLCPVEVTVEVPRPSRNQTLPCLYLSPPLFLVFGGSPPLDLHALRRSMAYLFHDVYPHNKGWVGGYFLLISCCFTAASSLMRNCPCAAPFQQPTLKRTSHCSPANQPVHYSVSAPSLHQHP